jgi:hypothetical protein
MKKGRGVSAIFRGVVEADVPSFFPWPERYPRWKGFGNIVHYLYKKRELEALDGKLERGEGFMVEFED